MDNVILRDVKPQDIKELKEIVKDTWQYEKKVKDTNTLDAMLNILLNKFFEGCSFGKVAVLNNEVVGLILGKVKGEPFIFKDFIIDETQSKIIIDNASEHDKTNIDVFSNIFEDTYKYLISGKEHIYEGCLNLFVVSEKARGMKVGKKLLAELLSYFKEKEVNKFYLFTDTNCNYAFYDHNGFERQKEKYVTFNFYTSPQNVNMFLYDYLVN